MGLFGNVLKNAVNNGISKGVSKGVSNAVSKAAEKIIAPKAEAAANKAAQEIDAATASIGGAANEAAQASADAAGKTGNGFSALENALNGWAQSAERYAEELSKNIKICTKCGEASSADKIFCPHCGEKLPEYTAAQSGICPKCGKQNVPGTKFCPACGEKLPEIVTENGLDSWDEKLAGIPKWCFGGSDFDISETVVDAESRFYSFMAKNSSYEALCAYTELLKKNGFVRKFEGTDETLYKQIGSEYVVVNQTEAMYDDTTVTLNLGRTSNLNEV